VPDEIKKLEEVAHTESDPNRQLLLIESYRVLSRRHRWGRGYLCLNHGKDTLNGNVTSTQVMSHWRKLCTGSVSVHNALRSFNAFGLTSLVELTCEALPRSKVRKTSSTRSSQPYHGSDDSNRAGPYGLGYRGHYRTTPSTTLTTISG